MPLSRYLKNDYLLFAWGDSTERFHAPNTFNFLISTILEGNVGLDLKNGFLFLPNLQ